MKLHAGFAPSRIGVTLAAIASIVCVTSSVFAQTTRTTPVEVKSPVSIDTTNNTVKAQQAGTWTVNLGGAPSVGITGTPNVNIANIPNVSVANTPTVKIDGTANTVKAQIDPAANTVQAFTLHKTIRLLSTDLVVPTNANYIMGEEIDCSGYRELRVLVTSGITSPNLGIEAVAIFQTSPTSKVAVTMGNATFASSTSSIGYGSLIPAGGKCIFSIPVMSDKVLLRLYNSTGSTVTLSNSSAWAYLVN